MTTRSTAPAIPLDLHQRHTIDETCEYLRLARAHVYKKIKAGELRILKDGRRTYVPGTEIAAQSRLA